VSADRIPADGTESAQALFSVTKGNPSPEDIAALTAVLAAVGSSEPETAESPARPTRRERIRRATLRPRHGLNQRRGRN
jgi:hypothetical protein